VSPVPETSPVELYFPRAGDQADQVLAEFIRGPTDQLRLAIYSLNRPVIAQAILAQHKAGVPLRLITDHVQSFGARQLGTLTAFRAAGLPIKTNHHSGLMHLKMAVRQDVVAIGSFNWTNNAEALNDEVLGIFADGEQIARAAWVFDCMWSDTQRFVDWHPPTAAEMGAMLTERPDLLQMPEF
jgi:phosphatidylserine/phosphatidylglycerophosphate/cardiolipin synthase-like enzyme